MSLTFFPWLMKSESSMSFPQTLDTEFCLEQDESGPLPPFTSWAILLIRFKLRAFPVSTICAN